jgi:hypothetical protein
VYVGAWVFEVAGHCEGDYKAEKLVCLIPSMPNGSLGLLVPRSDAICLIKCT